MSTYRKAILAYLDVLGFRALIRQSEADATKVDEIVRLLTVTNRKGKYGYDIENEAQVTTQYFSDLMVRTSFITPAVTFIGRLNIELMTLARIQSELTVRKIMIRGGVCLKNVFEDGELIFGPALVRSYELAEKAAVFSRIIIDGHLMKLAKTHAPPDIWKEVYKRGEDGEYFVDYLNPSLRDNLYVGNSFESQASLLSQHKETIEQALMCTSDEFLGERVRQKYIWMGLYHNSTLERFVTDHPDKTQALKPLAIDSEILAY